MGVVHEISYREFGECNRCKKKLRCRIVVEVMAASVEKLETHTKGSGLSDDIFLSEEFIGKFTDNGGEKN